MLQSGFIESKNDPQWFVLEQLMLSGSSIVFNLMMLSYFPVFIKNKEYLSMSLSIAYMYWYNLGLLL